MIQAKILTEEINIRIHSIRYFRKKFSVSLEEREGETKKIC